jgi:hypothetical protein
MHAAVKGVVYLDLGVETALRVETGQMSKLQSRVQLCESGILPGGLSCVLRRHFRVQSCHSGRHLAARTRRAKAEVPSPITRHFRRAGCLPLR